MLFLILSLGGIEGGYLFTTLRVSEPTFTM